MWNTPPHRRRRALTALAVGFGLAACIFSVDLFGLWLDGRPQVPGEPFVVALRAFLQAELAGVLMKAFYAAALGLASWVVRPWLLRRQAWAMARPRGNILTQLAFDATGIAAAIPGTAFRYEWKEVQAVREGPEHFGLSLPFGVVLPIPKRALDTADLVALRALLAEHAGQG